MASPQVPDGWKAEWDTRYRAWFYVNIQNGRSQWDRPKLLYPERRDHNSVQRTQGDYPFYGKWYKFELDSLPESHPDYLCNTCKHIDLRHIFYRSAPARTAAAGAYIHLGPFREMAEQQTCGLCRIVVSTIRERIKLSTKHEGFQLDDDVEELLNANWFLSPFVYEHESKPPTYNLILQHDKSSMLMEPREDTPFALRLIINAERGGRRIPEDTLDFAWIRTTISLCDINTKMSKRDFDYPILVVDTEEMCLVELNVDTKEEYVALSYPWVCDQMFPVLKDPLMCCNLGQCGAVRTYPTERSNLSSPGKPSGSVRSPCSHNSRCDYSCFKGWAKVSVG